MTPFLVGVSIGGVLPQVLFRHPYRGGIMGEASLSFRGDTISRKISWSSSSSVMFLEPQVQELGYRSISWGHLFSAVGPIVAFCGGLSPSVAMSSFSDEA